MSSVLTPDQLQFVLDHHAKWERGESGGERANLIDANLSGANLIDANLRGAYLYGAYLRGANLRGADLRGANLRSANLRGANLYGANLRGANLYGAYLENVQMDETTVWPRFLITPETGSFIAYKKVTSKDEPFILKLRIPKDAQRTNSIRGRKCRASAAKVLSATTMNGQPTGCTEFRSIHDPDFVYRVGETVTVPDYDPDIREECTKGIHFFITRQEAVGYAL